MNVFEACEKAETIEVYAGLLEQVIMCELPDCRERSIALTSQDEPTGTLQAKPNGGYSLNYQPGVLDGTVIRRLTPVECERLQGFPDGWTDVPYRGREHPADGPRYKAIGNSMTTNVMRWIGERVAHVDALMS